MINSRDIDIKILSVNEACAKFYAFFQKPSIEIDPMPFGNDHNNKLFGAPKSQSMVSVESLSSDIQEKLFQIPVMLCEIEKLQSSLDTNNNEIATESTLEQKRDLRDKLSNNLSVNLIALMDSKEIRNLSHPQSGKKLDELLYEISLTLAILNPVNDIDFATQEPITPENRIVTSDRYQHDINSLQQWLRHKTTNPWTNLKFTRRDINFIKLNLQSRKPSDAIEMSEGNSYPGGDPNLDATIALAQRLTEPVRMRIPRGRRIDFDMSSWPLNIAPADRTNDEHHEVESLRERPTPLLGFFRRQPNGAGNGWHYGDISVGDIPNFNEPRDTTPRYWATDIHQSEPQHSETAAPSTEDLRNAKEFKDKLAFFIDHHYEWPITESVNYIMTELVTAHSTAPIQIQQIHDLLTHKIIDRRSMSFFHYMPDPSEFRDYIENQRRSHRWSALYSSERERRMGRTVAEYAGKLTVVICVIDGYLAHHTHITASNTNLEGEVDISEDINQGLSTSSPSGFM